MLQQEYLGKLQQKKQQLRLLMERVEQTIQVLSSPTGKPVASAPSPPAAATVAESEWANLEEARGAEIFLWALQRLPGGAALEQIVSEVSQLPFQRVQERVQNKTMGRWMGICGKVLLNERRIKKTTKNGGVIYTVLNS